MVKKKITFSLFLILFLISSIPAVSADTDIAWTKSIGSVTAADISEYGEYIYAGSNNGTLICYDSDGTVQWQKSLSGVVVDIATTQSGDYAAIVTSSSDIAYLYDSAGGVKWQKNLPYTPVDVDISKDGGITTIVAGEQFWNYNTAGTLTGTYAPGGGSWSECAVDPDNNYLLLSNASENLYKYTFNNSIGWPDDSATSYVWEGWSYRQLITPTVTTGNISLNVSDSAGTCVDLVIPEGKTTSYQDLRLSYLNGSEAPHSLDEYFNASLPWTQATAAAGWSARYGHQTAFFDDKLWVLGGSGGGYLNDVWYSSDGSTWTQATAAAGWSGRYEHQVAVFDDKLWVFGGRNSSAINDVWYSSDGSTWTQTTAAAGWSARYGHQVAVFDDKLWVLGGYGGGYLNDVWYSSDGSTWTQATAAAGWSARYYHRTVVLDDKLWVLGGYGGGGYLNDVWYSSDGSTWTQATAAAGWSARYNHQAIKFNSKMWVLGGEVGGTPRSDVWYSSDGSTWTQAIAYPGWLARYGHQVDVLDNQMWVLGGIGSSTYNDVWASDSISHYQLAFPAVTSLYSYYGNPDAEEAVQAEIVDPAYYSGTIGSEETVSASTITEYQTYESHAGNITALDLPESGDWCGVSTSSNIYHHQITDTGFGSSYYEATSGTAYDIATADAASMSIEGRGIIADIYQIDTTKVGTYTTGGTVTDVAIADKSALWAAAGGTDGKVYVFSKDESSSWYLDYASDSYDPITALAMSWRGEYILAGRSDGLTLYSTGDDSSSDTTFWFTLYVFKDQEPYTYAPVNVSVYQNEIWTALAEGPTDSDGKYVIELTAGTKYKFNVNSEKVVILDASPSLTSKALNIITSPISTSIDYSAVYNSTSNKIEMTYKDSAEQTDSVTFTIYRTDTWDQVYSKTTGGNNVEDTYSVVDDTVNYKVELDVDRESGDLKNHFFVSTEDFNIPIPLDTNLKNVIFSGFLVVFAGLFGYASSVRGSIAVALLSALFVYVGWLTIPWFWIVAAICIAILAGFSQRRF